MSCYLYVFIASWTLVVVSGMLYPSILCVDGSFTKQFTNTVKQLGVIVILLLNVMEVFSVGGAALLDRSCMVFQRMCVLYL